MKDCRVLLVDDHSLLLDVLARFLAEIPEIAIVGRARDGLEAMEMAVLHRPDLVVMNLAMSGLNGLELTRRVATEPWAPRVVLMSLHDEPEYRRAAESAGADAFVLKQELGTKLVPLIRSLMKKGISRAGQLRAISVRDGETNDRRAECGPWGEWSGPGGCWSRTGDETREGEQDRSMFNARAMERMHVPAAPPRPATADNPGRRTLVYLLNFLLAGFERIPGTRIRPTSPPVAWLDEWEDDEYLYLETAIPGEASGLEIDLNVFNGVINARIRRRREDEGLGDASPAAGTVDPACDP